MKLHSQKLAGFVVVSLFISCDAFAQQSTKLRENSSQDPVAWLNMIAKAVKATDFSGTYIHQYGRKVDTARITHVVDESGEQEKLETLDGPPREVLRKNDDITCVIPQTKTIKMYRKNVRKIFPGLVSDVPSIIENYFAKLGGIERVAGFDCQQILLNPKDSFRFAHRFCAELNSGLLLRASMLNDKSDVLEQFVFTQIAIASPSAPISRDLVKSNYADSNKKPGWKVDDTGLQEVKSNESEWYLKGAPSGFKKIIEVRRAMSGKTDPVIQQIYSDGLASVSVFIESGTDKQQGLIRQGIYNLYVRSLDSSPFTVKVLGEVPNISLRQIGNSITNKNAP